MVFAIPSHVSPDLMTYDDDVVEELEFDTMVLLEFK